jgi:hypothetical protein
MMTTHGVSKHSALAIASALLGLTVVVGATPAGAVICANDPSRTIFAGGPGVGVSSQGACLQFTDEATCNMAFHQSGAGPLAPCRWVSGTPGNCEGNTRNQLDDTVAHSCQTLPAPSCADASRTIKLTGGTVAASGTNVCQTLRDQTSCETAWHTGAKGVGIACCWDGTQCVGSIWGFANSTCTHGNTCFVATGPAAAPAVSHWTSVALGMTLLGIGWVRSRAIRRRR